MNFLDLIIGLPIVLLAIHGYRKGLIKELASLVALILGIYVAIYFSGVVAAWLINTFDIGHRWVFVLAFIITFIGVVLLVSLIGKLLDKVASLAALGFLNRFAGLIFGVLKGALLISVLILIFNMIDSSSSILKEDVKKGSLLYNPVERIAPFVLMNLKNIDFNDSSWDDFKKKAKSSNPDKLVKL